MEVFSLCYSYDNRKNTFSSSGNNGFGLKTVHVIGPLFTKPEWNPWTDSPAVRLLPTSWQ